MFSNYHLEHHDALMARAGSFQKVLVHKAPRRILRGDRNLLEETLNLRAV